ncbi:MAG: hypothetical protein IKO47_13080 [Ruminococcus sp.]|nr:hypothetical protein [Ruminococcus sp.]
MFGKMTNRLISFLTAAVLTTSNVLQIAPVVAVDDGPDLTYQSIELYPNGEEAEQVVTLDGLMPERAEAEAIDVSEEYDGVAAYDITITDDGEEYQPGERYPILVEIVDPVIPESNSIELWHILDDGEREQIFDFTAEEGKVRFFATGFSVYQIVDAIKPLNIIYDVEALSGESTHGIYEIETIGTSTDFVYNVVTPSFDPLTGTATKMNSLQAFKDNLADGFYLSTKRYGYYAINGQENNSRDANRTGIALTRIYKTNNIHNNLTNAYEAGAKKFYFEEVDANNSYYKIYTMADDGTTRKYVSHNGTTNNVFLTNDENNSDSTLTYETVWKVGYNSDYFYFQDIYGSFNDKDCFLSETARDNNTSRGLTIYNNGYTDGGAQFYLWTYSPPELTEDPYHLNGQTYGLINNNGTKGYALMAGKPSTNQATDLGIVEVNRGTGSYTSQYGISGWTFEWIPGTLTYYVSAKADNGADQKYLKLNAAGISLVDASEASAIMVTPDRTTGRIKLTVPSMNASIIRSGSARFMKDKNTVTTETNYTNELRLFDLVEIPTTADALALDGKTDILVYNNQYAVLSTGNGSTLNRQAVTVKSETEYVYFNDLTEWTFTNVDTNRYIISTEIDGVTKYLKIVNGNGKVFLSDTEFILTVLSDDNKIKISNTTDKRWLGHGNSAFQSKNESDAASLNLASTTPAPTSDPLGLDGKTYGVIACDAENNKGIVLNSKTQLTYDAANKKYINTTEMLSGWTFHWEGENKYTLTNSEGKYLNSTFGVSDTAQVFAVIKDGDAITMYNPENSKVLSWNESLLKFDFQSPNTTMPHYFHLVDLSNQPTDPYGLDGRSFGLMYYQNGVYGYTMQAKANSDSSALQSYSTETRVNPLTHNYVNFVTEEDDAVSFWKFKHVADDYYQLSANTDNGVKYLNITSAGKLQLSDTPQSIRVNPGSGSYAGMIQLYAEGKYVEFTTSTFSAKNFDINNKGLFWLNLIEDVSMLIPDDFVVYTAKKVGVSEREEGNPNKYKVRNNEPGETPVHNEIIIYTRVWDATQNRYRFYAIDHDGSLVECYERGDNIMWIGSQVNTLKWTFIEYLYDDGTTTNYYDLYNPYSGKYIVPQIKDGQILVTEDQPRGINMPGRREGEYYTQFIKWDDANYAFAAVRANNTDTAIESCKKKQGDTFYFAHLDTSADLNEVETVDNSKYGITMKMVDFNGATINTDEAGNKLGCDTTVEQHTVMGRSHWSREDALKADSGLLSTNLEGEYPTALLTNNSLGVLFDKADTHVVNHLFIQSTLEQSGYFEYDSCQNFATLKDADDHDFGNPSKNSAGEYLFLVEENGYQVVKAYADPSTAPAGAKQIYDFRVTKELATYDSGGDKPSLKHCQFLPYDGIDAGYYATTNGWNLYDALQEPLSDSDPRKYERLHKIDTVDNYFGMELEASFIQTPNGKDNWNHPIIFEFTGDDDFWLYVDGELVIDLGGVHSALEGTVNFATGEVVVNGVPNTLRDIFYKNYRGYTPEEAVANIKRLKGKNNLTLQDIEADPELKAIYDRYMERHHTPEEAQQYVEKLFKETDDGHYVFKDYTKHTMKIFYMERGAGASNLHMRFNISSVNPGSVMLTKQVETKDENGNEIQTGIDGELDENLLQFPYQIWFATKDVQEAAVAAYKTTHEITAELEEPQIIEALNEYAALNPDAMLLTPDTDNFSIGYQQSARPIRYEESFTDNRNDTFHKVFFLYPGMSADIRFPEDTLYYKIIECGIDSNVYDITDIEGGDGNTNVNGATELPWTKVSDRPNVVYKNTVAKNAFKPLRITKILFDDQGNKVSYEDDSERYTFRLYLTDGISDNLKLTNMYKYHVLDPSGNYCTWDSNTGDFVSTGKSDLSQLQDKLDLISFETSINGAISNIPPEYTVEVPNLPLHSYFMVEERADETPRGYKYLRFSDHGTGNNLYPASFNKQDTVIVNGKTHTIKEEDRQCAGQIPEDIKDNDTGDTILTISPWVDIDNKQGWELCAEKVWSDKDFVKGHDNIYTAVYLKNSDGTETLKRDSIRELRSPDTGVWYYYDKLDEGHTFSDYAIYEVKLSEAPTSVTAVEDALRGTVYEVAVSDTTNVTKNEDGPLFNVGYMKNWEIQAQKDWTINSESSTYTAVYLKNTDGSETLLEDSIRKLDAPNTEVSYTFETLKRGHTFSDYAVYEVDLNQYPTSVQGTEQIVTVSEPGLVTKKPADGSFSYVKPSENGSYRVSYDKGTPTGGKNNVRTDSITNTRQGGLVIHLYEMNEMGEPTTTALKGGVFELKKAGDGTLLGEYVSDKDGLVTVMYDFDLNQEYILTETSAPKGYLGVPNTITIRINTDEEGTTATGITVSGNSTEWATGNLKSLTEEIVAEVDVYNPKFEVKFKKVDTQGQPLEGATFSIYRCVKAMQNGVDIERMDYYPLEGYKDFKSAGTTGIIFDICEANNNLLLPGKYYLYEEEAPTNYIGLEKPIKFEITDIGEVLIYEIAANGTETPVTSNQYLSKEGYSYLFTIPNQFSRRDYYFDIEKIIFVDKNVHDRDTEQKFIFKVDRFDEGTDNFSDSNIKDSFYVTLNCDNDITQTYVYPFSEETVDGKTFNNDKTITCRDGYSFPAAIWNGRKTVHVSSDGVYRVSEVSGWSSTDYDFWPGSNVYKGYGSPVRQGQSDGYVIFDTSAVKADQFKNDTATINGNVEYRPTASFTNSETEYAYLSSQAYADNKINR